MPTSPAGLLSAGTRPRVDTHPDYADTFGPEAIELAGRAGLILDPWQADALTMMLAFDVLTGKWTHFEYAELVARQNGKGAILEARALAGLFLLGEELIMWSAHEYKTAMEAFRRVLKLLRRIGTQVGNNENLFQVDDRLVKVLNTNGEESLEVLEDSKRGLPGQRLKFIARSKGSGRGFSGDINIIDETFAYTWFQHEALLPTVSARSNPQFIYTSSPPLDGATGEVLFALRERGDPTAPRKPEDGPWVQDPELAYRDWGLAGDLENLDKVDLDDQGNWRTTNPSLGQNRLTIKAVERERKSMGPAGFARERLGIWPRRVTTGAGIIPADLWTSLADANSERPLDRAFAIDINPARTHAAITAVGPRSDGQMVGSIIDYRAGTAWIPDRMAALKAKWNPVAIGLDVKGPGGSLLLDLKEVGIEPPADPDEPKRGDLAVPNALEVATAYAWFVDLVREEGFVHLDEPVLNLAVESATIRNLSGGSAWARGGDADICPLVSMTNGLWAYKVRIDLVTVEYDPLANIF